MSSSKKKPAPTGRPAFNSEGLCVVASYKNDLPPPPCPPKFLSVRDLLPADRFVRYTQQTSLEKTHKPQLLVGPDVGVEIDIIDDLPYIPDESAQLHPTDAQLLVDDTKNQKRGAINRPAVHTKLHVPWLRKTSYISTETRAYGKGQGGGENKVFGRNLEESDLVVLSRDEQVDAIEKTFEFASIPDRIRHPLNANLTIKSIRPLLPDYQNWGKDFCQGTFDVDPKNARDGITASEQRLYTSQSILVDADSIGDDPVATMYLPVTDSFTKRKRRRGGEESPTQAGDKYTYVKVRDYIIKIQNKVDMAGMDLYSFAERDGKAYYVGLERSMRFSRRRLAKGEVYDTNAQLIIEHKELSDESMSEHKRPIFYLEAEDADAAEEQASAELGAMKSGDGENDTSPKPDDTATSDGS